MSATQDYVALDWIKGEIAKTLEQAQFALESIAESPDDVSSMRSCLTSLHQVYGTLKMVELTGPAQVADEMEQVAQALMNKGVPDISRAQEILMQTILQMPRYLDQIQREQSDSEENYLPLVNNLRIARGESRIGEVDSGKVSTGPDLSAASEPPTEEVIAAFVAAKGEVAVPKLRQRYQQSLAALLKKTKARENLSLLGKVLAMMLKLCGDSPMGNLAQLGVALVEGVATGAIKLTAPVVNYLRALDAELARMSEGGVAALSEPVSKKLVLGMLRAMEGASKETEKMTIAKAIFSSSSEPGIETTEEVTIGPDDETLAAVAKILIEEVKGITDKLDLYVLSASRQISDLVEMIPALEQIASTLMVVSLSQHQEAVSKQIGIIKEIEAAGIEPDEEVLLEFAKDLLEIESTLGSIVGGSEGGAVGESIGDLDEAQAAVVAETRNGLGRCRDALISFVSSDFDHTKIQEIPTQLSTLRGGLLMVNQERPGDVLSAAARYLEERVLASGTRPETSELDDLADAITSIDYYLERLIESAREPYLQMLEVAEAAVERLGFAVGSEPSSMRSEPAETEMPVEESTVAVEDIPEFEDSVELVEDSVELVEDSVELVEDSLEPVENPAELVEDIPELHEVSSVPFEESPDLVEELPVPVEDLSAPAEDSSISVEDSSISVEDSPAVEVDEDDLIDDEILEIFGEEVDEVLETINEYLPRWKNDTSDLQALAEIRRAFHGLKGSGRMVGATVLGELTWSIEELLNKIVDHSIEPNDDIMTLMAEVIGRIPEGLDYFKNHDQHAFLIDELVIRAENLGVVDGAQRIEEAIALELDEPTLDVELDVLDVEEEVLVEPEEEVLVRPEKMELDEIFSIEANQLILPIQEYLKSNGEITGELVAALHTLRGSAAMAGISSISDIAAPLEQLANQYFTSGKTPDAAFKRLVERGSELIGSVIGNLNENREKIDGLDPLLTDVEVVLSSDEEPAAILNFEDILLLCEEDVVSDEWPAKYVIAVQAELEHAREQAEMLGQKQLQALTTSLLRVYGLVESAPDETLISALKVAHARLVNMFNQIAASQDVENAEDVIAMLDAIDYKPAEEIIDEIIAETTDEIIAETADEIIEEVSAETETAVSESQGQALPEDKIDEDILPIFLEEAEELMEGIDQNILDWSEDSRAMANLDNLLRNLHTLKGGSRMAGLNSLGQIAHNFESFLIGMQQNPIPFNEDFFASLNQEQDEITRRIEIYRKLEIGAATDEELLSLRNIRAEQARQPISEPAEISEVPAETESTTSAATTDEIALPPDEVALPRDEIDEDVLPIFLEETEELLEGLEESIQNWSEDIGDTSHLENLLRNLHTFKGGARMAGMNSLGEYVHNFETLLIGIQKDPVDLGTPFFTLLNMRQDEIRRRVEIYGKLAVGEASEEELASLTKDVTGADAPLLTDEQDSPGEPGIDEGKKETARTTPATQPQEMVRVSADLLEELIGFAGESSITRGRIEQQISDFGGSLQEMEETIKRIRDQVRKLEIEAESRETLIRSRSTDGQSTYDELEMDRYTMLQEISRTLNESTSDMLDLKETLVNSSRDAETLLHQQARIGSELQEGLTRTRMVPFVRMIPRLRRIVRQTSAEINKSVRFDAFNIEGELDRTILERVVAPLEHMLRNAVDHGIEPTEKRIEAGKPEQGRISLRLSREGGYVVLIISDDGGGIDVDAVRDKAIERGLIKEDTDISDQEVMQFIMDAGFSTAQKLTQISGRGVGMDVVTSEIKALGGNITIDSTVGVGTEFTIRIPFTVSINRALMVVVKEETYAVPLNTIEGIVRVSPYELEAYYQPDAPMFEYAGQPYRLDYMGKMLSNSGAPDFTGQVAPLPVILARSGDRAAALQVDRVIGSREVVVKTLGPQFNEVGGIAGATVLGDGSVVFILDVMALVRTHDLQLGDRKDKVTESKEITQEQEEKTRSIMIVDDSVTVRKVTSRLMERQGWLVMTAKDGVDALEQLQESDPDIMLLDIEMPKLDGFGVLKAVRQDERMKDLPIIMITSRTGEKHKQEALGLGVDRYIGKPYLEANLVSTIDEILSESAN